MSEDFPSTEPFDTCPTYPVRMDWAAMMSEDHSHGRSKPLLVPRDAYTSPGDVRADHVRCCSKMAILGGRALNGQQPENRLVPGGLRGP